MEKSAISSREIQAEIQRLPWECAASARFPRKYADASGRKRKFHLDMSSEMRFQDTLQCTGDSVLAVKSKQKDVLRFHRYLTLLTTLS